METQMGYKQLTANTSTDSQPKGQQIDKQSGSNTGGLL
jgi:hypothetical protein